MIEIETPCKINLFLEITGKLENGYHTLQTIMQSVSLFDRVTIQETRGQNVKVLTTGMEIPTTENIVYKAAKAFCSELNIDFSGFRIELIKRIPSQAGLGGGSSDGAAVLKGLNKLLGYNLDDNRLIEIGARVGADIPFCIKGGTALVEGFGERITPLSGLPGGICWVIVKPLVNIATKEAFSKHDEYKNYTLQTPNKIIHAINNADLKGISKNLYNVFESSIGNEEINRLKDKLLTNGGLGAVMSGSGSAVVGLFEDYKSAEKCVGKLREDYAQTFLVQPV